MEDSSPDTGAVRALILLALGVVWILGTGPSLHWLDTSELAASSFALGIGHPPGQVPFMLLGSLAQWIPFGDASFRLAVATTLLLISILLAARVGRSLWLPVVGLSGLFALQVLRVEVYALSGALLLISIQASEKSEGDARWGLLAAFLWGLAALNHPAIALLGLPFFVRRLRLLTVVFGILPALGLLFLVARSANPSSWTFIQLDHVGVFADYVRGRLYKAYDVLDGGVFVENLQSIIHLLFKQLTPTFVLLSGLGLLLAYRHDRPRAFRVFTGLTISVFTLAWMGNFWPQNPDAQGYLLSASFLLLGLVDGAWADIRSRVLSRAAWILGLVVSLSIAYQGVRFVREVSIAEDWGPHRHMVNLLSEIRPSREVYVGSFSTFSALRYGQVLEGRRPDLRIAFRGQASVALESLEAGDFWELAISRDPKGRYALREEDLLISSRLTPVGWFMCFDCPAEAGWKATLGSRLANVRSEGNKSLSFRDEPLILNYLLKSLWCRSTGDKVCADQMVADGEETFPGFPDWALFKESP